jgi:hypothetical protein
MLLRQTMHPDVWRHSCWVGGVGGILRHGSFALLHCRGDKMLLTVDLKGTWAVDSFSAAAPAV